MNSQLVVYSLFSLFCIVCFFYFKKVSKRHDMAIQAFNHLYNFSIHSKLPQNIRKVDAKFFEEANEGITPSISEIAGNFDKGYNFLHLIYPKGSNEVPLHKHLQSNELIYVINGKIRIIVGEKKKFLSSGCLESSKVLPKGGWYYIKSKTLHKIEILEDSEFIVVAKPPIFKKAGKLNEKIRSLFKKR